MALQREHKNKKIKSAWHSVISGLMIFINVVAAIGLLVSAYSGSINPIEHPTASAVNMTFPIWIAFALIVLVFSIFIRYKAALITFAAILISIGNILNFSPVHLTHKTDNDDTSFSIMSYNVFGLIDQNDSYPGDINPTLNHIISENTDIVCLQEMQLLSPSSAYHITSAQIDSLHRQYPYILIANKSQAILSKYPVETIQTGFQSGHQAGSAALGCFRVDINGTLVTIFNVHLQSFSLLAEDREMFTKLTHLKGNEEQIAQMRSHLINKIRQAAPQRVKDTEELIKYIQKFGGPNVIICGDFNDVPGCYPLRMLGKEHFKEVYPEVGLGPMITYNAGGFYFRIDHILYRGNLKPTVMKRGDIKSSDHYPITATFEISNQ